MAAGRRRPAAQEADHRHRRLLRARRQRPRRRAAEQGDELAPLHSITSSARASSMGGSEAERLGGPEVDRQARIGRLHDRQIGWFRALEDAADIDAAPGATRPPGWRRSSSGLRSRQTQGQG